MEKIKQFLEGEKGKDIIVVIIVILVGLASFELGRLSNKTDNSGIKIEYPGGGSNQTASVISNVSQNDNQNENFFASNRGTKYYSLGCSAGKTIKQENRIYFETREEAERAGYELSSSCR